jgi:hypothetical protein
VLSKAPEPTTGWPIQVLAAVKQRDGAHLSQVQCQAVVKRMTDFFGLGHSCLISFVLHRQTLLFGDLGVVDDLVVFHNPREIHEVCFQHRAMAFRFPM